MLEALAAGNDDPHELASLASLLRQLHFLDPEVEQLNAEVIERTRPIDDAIERLDAIPGVGRRIAEAQVWSNPCLRQAPIKAAWAVAHTKVTYQSSQYHHLAARRSAIRTILAVAHNILVTIYHMLSRGTTYLRHWQRLLRRG